MRKSLRVTMHIALMIVVLAVRPAPAHPWLDDGFFKLVDETWIGTADKWNKPHAWNGAWPTIRPAPAAINLSDFPGLKMQCGPLTIIVTKDRKVEATGLPDGVFPITVKDNEFYINGHICKPICNAPAEQRC